MKYENLPTILELAKAMKETQEKLDSLNRYTVIVNVSNPGKTILEVYKTSEAEDGETGITKQYLTDLEKLYEKQIIGLHELLAPL